MTTLNIKRKAYYMNASDREKADTVDTPLKPLISVIVPIYNVEKYVRKCLESLVNQTMKQIEVICIDDGSTDGSGVIADEYESSEYPIFRIFHTENRGISAARNRGIDEAWAEWLMFVDSDDWVDREFCRIPYEAAIENKADMVIFGRYLTNEQGKVKKEKPRKSQTGIIDHETAIDIGWPAVWNKMYHKSLFDGIRYPEGFVYEELLTTHKLVYTSQRIVYLHENLYYYRTRRNGGITQSVNNDAAWLKASEKQAKELMELGYAGDKAQVNLWRTALKCCGRAKSVDDPVYKEALRIMERVKGVLSMFSPKEKLMITIWQIDRSLYRMAYRLTRR